MIELQILGLFYRMSGHLAIILGASGGLAAAAFQDDITVAAIVITGVMLGIAGLFTIRARIAEVWRTEAAAQKERADRLEGELAHERDIRRSLAAKVESLEQRTDLIAAVDGLRAIHTDTVTLLGEIRDRLDPPAIHAVGD